MTRKQSIFKLVMVIFICFFSTNLFASSTSENLYKTKLVWNEVFSMPVSLTDMGILKTDSYLYLFDEKEYYAISLKNINKKSKWSKFEYKTRKSYITLDTFDLHGATSLGDNVYIKARDNYFKAIIKPETGELVDYKLMFYELSADDSKMHEGYGRLYTFGESNRNGYMMWYGLNLPTANSHITKWNTHWVDPKTKGLIRCATFYDGKLFYLNYGVKTGVIPINENGMLGLSSMNAELPGDVELSAGKSIVSFNNVLYVLNESGRVVSAPIDSSGTIYEWYDLGKIAGRPIGKIYGEGTSYPSHWYSSAYLTTTKQGLLSISTRFMENGKKVLEQVTSIHLAKLPKTDENIDPSAEKLTLMQNPEEQIMKPESRIKTLNYVPSLNMFFAWDEAQNRLLRSEDKGKTWKYTNLSFPRDQRTNNSHSGMLKQIVITSDEKNALCLLTHGLFKFDLEFVKGERLGDKGYYNESVANKQQFAINRENPKMLLMPIGKTIYKSGNYGKNWIERNRGLEYYRFGAIAYVPWNDKSVLLEGGAYYDESMYYFSQDEGENWILFNDWLKNESFTGVENVYFSEKSGQSKIISPNDKFTFIIGTGGDEINVVKIDWEKKQISSNSDRINITQLKFSDAFVMGENFQTILVSGTLWDSNTESPLPETFRSVDGGKTFSKIVGDDNKLSFGVYSFCKDPESQNTVWGGGRGGVFVSRDAGETWNLSQNESLKEAHNENFKKVLPLESETKKTIDIGSEDSIQKGKVIFTEQEKNEAEAQKKHNNLMNMIPSLVSNYYNTEGPWSGVFQMGGIKKIRTEPIGGNKVRAHVLYKYLPVPNNSKGRTETGHDQRTFDIVFENGEYRVFSIGEYQSASF